MTVSSIAPAYGKSGYEFFLGTVPISSDGLLYIQILDQAGLPLSDNVYIDTFNDCSKNLALVRFKKNPMRGIWRLEIRKKSIADRAMGFFSTPLFTVYCSLPHFQVPPLYLELLRAPRRRTECVNFVVTGPMAPSADRAVIDLRHSHHLCGGAGHEHFLRNETLLCGQWNVLQRRHPSSFRASSMIERRVMPSRMLSVTGGVTRTSRRAP